MDKEDKRKIEEYEKNPMANFADSVNRSQIGDLSSLTKGSLLTRIITSIVVIAILFLIFYKWLVIFFKSITAGHISKRFMFNLIQHNINK